jgi:ParB family transcriptional regulator, chromosome partitioning protein
MSGIERFTSRLGGNIRESMGAAGSTGAGGPLPTAATAAGPSQYHGVTRPKDALTIPLDRIVPDADQPRKEFDEGPLAELAASLKTRGQLQPIRVRWSPQVDRWVIVAGERRYRAALMAGLASLVCVEAKGTMTPEEILEEQLIENALREDLKPIEQARAYKALVDRRGCSYRQLAESLNISHMAITRALNLLTLPTAVQERVESGQLAPSVAYEVSRLEDPADQVEVAARVVADKLSRAETVEAVKRAASKPRATGKGRGTAKAKPRKVTERVIRTEAGPRVIVEFKRGLDGPAVLAALREATAKVAAELAELGDDQVAA